MNQHFRRKRIDGEPIVWEREVIKNELFHQNPDYPADDSILAYDNERYIRALLGLAGQHSYPQKNIPIADVRIEDVEYKNAEDEKDRTAKKIDRFKSPLTFKPIGNKIYLIVEEIPSILYNREFEFQPISKTKGDERSSLTMKTPPLNLKLNLYEFVKSNMRNWYPV